MGMRLWSPSTETTVSLHGNHCLCAQKNRRLNFLQKREAVNTWHDNAIVWSSEH